MLTSRSREGVLISSKDSSNPSAGGSGHRDVSLIFLMLFCLLVLLTYWPHEAVLSLIFFAHERVLLEENL